MFDLWVVETFFSKILDSFYAAGNPPKYWHPQS